MSMTTPRLLMLVACVLLQTLATYANAIPDPSDRETGPKIINGTQAEANATRHQVSVRRRRNDSYFFGTGHICGGSLITPSVVLSAAHCFVDYDSENGTFAPAATFIVVMGNLDRFERNNNTLVYDITHILYRVEKFNLSSFEQDVALAFLAQDVPASHPTVRPIALHRAALVDDTMCQVTGWGNTEEGYLSDVLMTVDVPIITAGVCGQETDIPPSYLHEGMVCAGYSEGERDACGGDSGGPLVCGGLLAGIVSWGSGCAQPRLPGVYTDVSFHAPWIAARVEEAGGTLAGNGAAATAGFSPLLAVVAAGLLVLLTTLPRE